MSPSSRNAARRYADKSRRRRPGRVLRADGAPITGEQTISQDAVAQPEEPSSAPVIQHGLGGTRVTISPRSRQAASRPSTFESTDYGYVIGDLRRVMVVAGSLVVGLLILSLVIR